MKNTFNSRLRHMINEHMIFMDEPITAEIDEDSIVGEIRAAAPQHNMQYINYAEGIISFMGMTKTAVESFCVWLDDNVYVDSYAISVIETNPLTGIPHKAESIEFDFIKEGTNIEFYVDVVINSDYIKFNDVYVDTDAESDDNEFDIEVPIDDIDDVYDTIPSNEVPILVTLSNIELSDDNGSVVVTVHPKNENKILVQVVYDESPVVDNVLEDLSIINDLHSVYDEYLTLDREAKYNLGDKATTSAVYTTINDDNVLNIVEVFGSYITSIDVNTLSEVRRKIKVNHKGKRRIKMQCQPGFKYDHHRKTCVKISGSEMARSRIAHRQMARTKKALGTSYQTKILRKVRRAKRFRKILGLQK